MFKKYIINHNLLHLIFAQLNNIPVPVLATASKHISLFISSLLISFFF